jgi:DNA-binding SARP family transcriptional activator/tetratricopeptide (TPR) repeat protein
MNSRLTVATLGPLRAFAGTQEVVLGPPKQRAVFAILALRANDVVSRDDLVDGVWGESPPATAAGNLHTYMSGLRRALSGVGEPLTSSRTGYVLRLDSGRLDIRVVEQLMGQARESRARRNPAAAAAAYAEALAHWRSGAALSGLPGPFVAGYQTRMSDLRLQVLLEHAEVRLELHEPATVVDRLREHARDNPHHERLRALLMTALRQSNQTADALAQYHDLRKRLADDLGIDPSAELQALYAAILADNAATPPAASTPASPATTASPATPAAEPVRPAEIPRGVGHFVGRVASIRQVLDTARTTASDTGRDRSPQIVMIVGVGGVGKTALAVHCAHQLAADYPDGQLYVNLRGFDPRHPARSITDALHHLLTSVGAGTVPAGHEQRVALWRSIVRNRRMLIVLDNAERADQVEDLLPGGSPSFVVVTSRNRLSALAVRYGARRVTLSPFTAEESLQLFADAIGNDRVDTEPAAARALADLCGHLPLALRIAAEQVVVDCPISDLISDLQDVERRLDGLQVPGDELYSVRGVLSWSYARLDAAASHAFRMLGLFPGVSISVAAATALLDVPRLIAAAALRTLADQHLLETTGGMYWMHDLTRIYAREVAADGIEPAARRQTVERVTRWYLRTLADTEHRASSNWLLFPPQPDDRHEVVWLADQNAVVAWCVREWENIAPLLRTAQRLGCHEEVWQLSHLLFSYFYAAGQAREWVETLRIGMRSAELVANRAAQAGLFNHLSIAHSRLGQNDAAVQELRRALQLLEELGEDLPRVSPLANLASTLREAKRYEEALPYARQALELAMRGSDYHQAGSLDVICQLHAEMGEFSEALRYGEPGLAAARRCRDVLLEANILINLGVAEHGLGDATMALRYFDEALVVCEASGDRYHEALALFGQAKAGSDPRSARDLAGRALRHFRDLDAEEVGDVTAFLQTLEARTLDADPPPAGSR